MAPAAGTVERVDAPDLPMPAQHVVASATAVGELALGLSPWAPRPRPGALDDLTPDMLSGLLGSAVVGARVERIDVVGGSAGTTDRRRLALHWNDAGREAGLPRFVFAKATARPPQNRALSAFLRMSTNEVDFYRSVRDDVAEIAPACFAGTAGHGGRFALVLEDLEAAGCTVSALADECDLTRLEGTMDALAILHAEFWESERFDGDLGWVAPQRRRAGFALETLLFRGSRRAMLRSDREIPDRVCRLTRVLSSETWPLARLWEQGPLTFVHGDSHLGNSYARRDGAVGYFDWQVGHRAHGMRDVAYFLGTSAPTELRRAHERDLIERYTERLREGGVHGLDASTAWELYRIFAVDAWDATVVTAAFSGLQDAASMERGFRQSLATVDDLDSLDAIERALRRGSLC